MPIKNDDSMKQQKHTLPLHLNEARFPDNYSYSTVVEDDVQNKE